MISFISTLGVTVGVMALVIALALMTGLQNEIRDRIVGANPHIYVWKTGGIDDYHAESELLRQVPHVIGAAPAILGKALISASRSEDFINLTGIDPDLELSVTDIRSAMLQGSVGGAEAGRRRTDRGRHPARQGSGGGAGRGCRRLGVGRHAARHAVADGDGARAAPAARRRDLQPRPLRVRQHHRVRVARGGAAPVRERPRRPDPVARGRHLRRARHRARRSPPSSGRNTSPRTGRR